MLDETFHFSLDVTLTGTISGSISSATPVDAAAKVVALLGDSITSQNDSSNDQEFNSQGYLTWLRATTGQRYYYQPSHNLGGSGQGVADTIANIAELSALNPVPTLVFWVPFANDVVAARTYADLITDFDAVVAYVTGTLGAEMVITTPLPRTESNGDPLTAPHQTLLDDLKTYILALSVSGVTIVNIYDNMTSTGDNPDPAKFDDESGKLLHPNPNGAQQMASDLKAALDLVYGSFDVPDMTTGALGVNSDISGTGGTDDGKIAGAVVADNFNFTGFTGITGTVDKDLNDKQDIDVSYTDNLSFDAWEYQANDVTTGFTEGEQYYLEAEIEVLSASNVRSAASVQAELTGGVRFQDMNAYDINSWPDSFVGTLHLRTPLFAIGSTVTDIEPIVWARMDSVGITSSTNVIVKQMRFVKPVLPIAGVEAVESSTMFDLSANSLQSYDGTEDGWRSLASTAGYDFTLGQSSANTTDDPVFTGTAGDPAAYFLSDASSNFTLETIPTVWDEMHQTGNGNFFWTFSFKYQVAGLQVIAATNTTASAAGMRVLTISDELYFQQRGAATVSAASGITLVDGTEYVITVTHNTSTNETLFFVTDATSTTTATITHTFSATVLASSGILVYGAAANYGGDMAAGTEFYSFSGGNSTLDQTAHNAIGAVIAANQSSGRYTFT